MARKQVGAAPAAASNQTARIQDVPVQTVALLNAVDSTTLPELSTLIEYSA